MREVTHISTKGLFVFILTLTVGFLGLNAQILNQINNGVKTVTQPAKDATKVVKEVAEPAKEVNKATKTIVKAPEKVEKEYEKVGKEVEKTEKEYEKTGDQFKKATGTGDDKGKTEDKKDSTATAADGKAGTSPSPTVEHKSTVPEDYKPEPKVVPTPVVTKKAVDPMDVPRPIPPGSRDNKTPSGPMPAANATAAKTEPPVESVDGASDNKGVAVDQAADGKGGPVDTDMDGEPENVGGGVSSLQPLPTTSDAQPGMEDAANGSDAQALTEEASLQTTGTDEESPAHYVVLKSSGAKRPRPDYSHSPARVALEKAEFDIETLEDLYRYSNWEGPEREHTVRAVAQALDELQHSIVEIKKLDPGQSTWRFEESYKDMKAAYIEEMKRKK